MNAPEFERVHVISEDFKEMPWKSWSSQSPNWWIAYNKIKHELLALALLEGVRNHIINLPIWKMS